MTQDEARQRILAEWRKLPPEERATEDQAVVFAFRALNDPFVTGFRYRGDKYQVIKNWLVREMELTRVSLSFEST